MTERMNVQGEVLAASQKGALEIEQFLRDNYLFRRNELNGKVEFMEKPASDADISESGWQVLTNLALNSIIIRAKREDVCEKDPKADIELLVNSEEIVRFNPIQDYLGRLPQWDGQNHVARLFGRLPGVDSELQHFLAVWLRSAVAHWLQMDTIHGNECVPTLIGSQGCGKTTFFNRLLPPHLRQYYLDHLNLSNKFDKEMALTNNLFVNLDELDAIRPSQQAALKQTLSKSKVNGRVIYGSTQQDRLRYASFVATTNNPHPLQDPTGSRRHICVQIPDGMFIDNDGEIDYDQLYAQVLYEVREQKSPYWFNNDEVARIQELNQNFMAQPDMAEMVKSCFRKPEEGEYVMPLKSEEMLRLMQNEFSALHINQSTKIYLGMAMKSLGYDRQERHHVAFYKAVPLKADASALA